MKETASSHLKMDAWKDEAALPTIGALKRPNFRERTVSFGEGSCLGYIGDEILHS